jgi:hypothetical protein
VRPRCRTSPVMSCVFDVGHAVPCERARRQRCDRGRSGDGGDDRATDVGAPRFVCTHLPSSFRGRRSRYRISALLADGLTNGEHRVSGRWPLTDVHNASPSSHTSSDIP